MVNEEIKCPALAVRDLSAGYPGLGRVVENVTFNVEIGERIAVMGPNGAGKSTLLKALVGLIPHFTGEISLHGEDCRTSHRMLGYVPQHELVDWDFPVNVRDVVMMGRTRKIGWFRWPRRHDWEMVDKALEQVGMQDFAKRQIDALSGGQKRRVFIARALVQETNTLILDEPFSGVDVSAEQDVMDTLDHLKEQNFTVILATHDLHTASERFDKLMFINQRMIAYGRPNEVFTPSVLQDAYGGRVGVFEHEGRIIVVADEHAHGQAHA